MLLTIEETQVAPDITVVELVGKLALGREGQRIEGMIDALLARGSRKLVVDLSKVDYIDSAGVGLLALASGKMKQSDGKAAMVVPEASRVRQLLKLTQMDTVLSIFETAAAAIEAMGGKAASV